MELENAFNESLTRITMLIDFVKRESETDMSQRLLVKKYDTPRPTGYKQEMMSDVLQTKKVLFP